MDDMKEYKMTKDMVQIRSVWHMNTKANTLLHEGDIGEKKLLE